MEQFLGGVIGGLVVILMGVLMLRLDLTKVERNGLVGIRTSATLASDEAWAAGHSAAKPMMRVAGWTAIGFGVATIVLAAIFGALDIPGAFVVAIVGCLVVLGLLFRASQIANQAARRTL